MSRVRDRWHREHRTISRDSLGDADAELLEEMVLMLSSLLFGLEREFFIGMGRAPVAACDCSCNLDDGEDILIW